MNFTYCDVTFLTSIASGCSEKANINIGKLKISVKFLIFLSSILSFTFFCVVYGNLMSFLFIFCFKILLNPDHKICHINCANW